MEASFPAPNRQIYHPFPPYYFNQNRPILPNQINFIDFTHFHNQILSKNPHPPSPFSSSLSFQTFHCKQENQVNFQDETLPPAQNYPFAQDNLKNEQFIQTKCEDEPIHGKSSSKFSSPG